MAKRRPRAEDSRRDPLPLGAPAVDPIVMSSFFTSAGDPVPGGFHYTRGGNPNWDALETALGGIEAAPALLFASGMAAVHALLLSLTADRRRLVLLRDGYYEVRRLASMMPGLEFALVDPTDERALARELAAAPAVLWIETPTNPLLRVVDIQRTAELARSAGAVLVVDNTVATAALQRPLDLGALATVYSLSKAISGHSDLLLGAVVTRDASLRDRLLAWRQAGGAIAGPFEAWLALRGFRTLKLRIERQSANALALARHLAAHPAVKAAHYPGLDGPDRAIAERQMHGGFGPLLSFEVDGEAAAADAVVAAARFIRAGTSFGGVDSSWERRARWQSETAPPSLIRLSAGIEEIEELVADVDRALKAVGKRRGH